MGIEVARTNFAFQKNPTCAMFFEAVISKVRVSFDFIDQQLDMICPTDRLKKKIDFFPKLLSGETFFFVLPFKIISDHFIIVLFNMNNVLLYINYDYFKQS